MSGGWRAPPRTLRARDRLLELGGRPLLMGIVNASPDSFSDGARHTTFTAQAELAGELRAAGAEVLDIGGESATTGRPPVQAAVEIERVLPLVELAAGELGAVVSVDTYKPEVARAAIDAGAHIVNDVSGLRDPQLAQVCAQTGAALVVMHTLAAPRERRQEHDLYGDIAGEVIAFLRERMDAARAQGVADEQLIVDPGPDFAKTPAQTIRLLAEAERLHELRRPVLMAISRKDFIGALTRRPPRERLAGTLAAVAHAVRTGAHLLRVHDAAAAAEFLRVLGALEGMLDVDDGLELAEGLRHEQITRASR